MMIFSVEKDFSGYSKHPDPFARFNIVPLPIKEWTRRPIGGDIHARVFNQFISSNLSGNHFLQNFDPLHLNGGNSVF